ncbi:cytochrome p450 protein [Penicillium viridicatum]|nr:cytochrome p450 protein [Penicillium viridicatum]
MPSAHHFQSWVLDWIPLHESFNGWTIPCLLVGAWVVYGSWLGIYRLFLSPLAKFPGPKLAALTQWYEVYLDIVKKGGGQFPFEIKRMHDKYGPIVRISPFELHVDDPDFYDVIYATNKAYDKMEHFQHRFNVPLATFSTSDSDEHRIRRAAINPFFSKSRVRSQNERIQQLASAISQRLTTEYAGQNKPLDVANMWGCFTADVIMDIVFAHPKNFSRYPDFESPFTLAIRNMATWAHVTLHFGWILTIMNQIPDRVAKALFPPFRPIIEFREEMASEITDILEGRNKAAKDAACSTVFNDILSSSLPPQELLPARLNDEAVSLVGAGTETTSWSLTIGTFHVINNPHVALKLKAELAQAIPDPNEMPSWTELERLPYLSAVVKERKLIPSFFRPSLLGTSPFKSRETVRRETQSEANMVIPFAMCIVLRVAFGGVERLPRINRHGTWTYAEWKIPAGTPVGMDQYHMHMNEDLYPDPTAFRPERWLGNPRAPHGEKPLTHYLTPFAKGTRMCTGFNLAYAEIFIGIATVFRRHEFELFETSRRDVDFYAENLKASPWPGSKGVRVLVKGLK